MAFATAAIIGASVAGAGGLAKLGMSLFGRKDRKDEQTAAKKEMAKYKEQYENLDTSNLYADARNEYAGIQTNFENVYEDLTVNQQQAQFQAQQGSQQRANIMQNMRGKSRAISNSRNICFYRTTRINESKAFSSRSF